MKNINKAPQSKSEKKVLFKSPENYSLHEKKIVTTTQILKAMKLF